MNLTQLDLSNFRCFSTRCFKFSTGFNVLFGSNGTGKTAILEAIYYLGVGKSFRTHLLQRIIRHDQESFSLFARIDDLQSQNPSLPISFSVGIGQSVTEQQIIKINGEKLNSRAELAALLPIQLINTESYRLIDSGPSARREFLDWAVFHVKPTFFPLWRRVRQAIKQRNAAIKYRKLDEVTIWDQELSGLGEELAILREQIFNDLLIILQPLLTQLLPTIPISLRYYRGWSSELSLQEALKKRLSSDLELGHTSVGPHRGDIVCRAYGIPVEDVLSRGQQKLLVIAMRLAQGLLLSQKVCKKAIYLLDDVAAELDERHRSWVMSLLKGLNSQVILTAITPSDLADSMKMAGIYLEANVENIGE